MKYIVIVQDKDKNPFQSTVEANSIIEALVVGEQYCFGRNKEGGNEEVFTQNGYNVVAVIGEHPMIKVGLQ